jgi:type I restriction-modification system DNA methylase subunit
MAQPPPQVLELIQRFDSNREAYRSPQYNETQLRREFLDPLFKALGWDIDNEQGYAEAYKDVVHEDAIRIGEGTKAPDYCFRIGGTRKYFLEAKRPSIDIKNDPSPAYQLRRYGWSKKLSLSVLSDFEEFAVYDCRFKPNYKQSAAFARILYIPYTEYALRWDEIAGVFSRDAVLKGAFDKFTEATKAKSGTIDVDEDFLKTIETWRAELARILALRNPKLSQRELNFSVQRIIDRIIFLRICEGRGIEDHGRLRALTNGDRIYPRLCQVFEEADARCNSGLFHFKPEKDRHEAPDELTLGLEIDDKLLRDIVRSLYLPDSPCVFSALPADILGQVYEQFLGKIIRLTEGHRAVVEEKPEVKKAGGVYYTPTYVVDYIVQTTVGHLLEGKTPTQATKLKILDPACGSGSFLIVAYEYLLNWHRDFYTTHDPAKWSKGANPALVQIGAGNWKLTIAERKRILLDNIFGVDIDSQAVETTKLSLLLKVLEGETQQSLQPVLRFFHQRALPDLGDNIKCGNSLIGPDFYQQQQMALLDEEEHYRVNVFDWQAEFPHIFRRKTSSGELHETPTSPLDYTWPGVPLHGSYSRRKIKVPKVPADSAPIEPDWEGGFDAVIGNPPYVRIQGFPADQILYLTTHYRSATGNCDLYVSFIERSLNLLNQEGALGVIAPNKFFRTEYGEGLRGLLASRRAVRRIVDFGANQVFAATTYTCLLFLHRRASDSFEYAKSKADKASLQNAAFCKRDSHALESNSWTFETPETASLLAKLEKDVTRLLDLPTNMGRGSSTGDDNVFVFETGTLRIEEDVVREPLFASDFGRYNFAPSGKWSVIFPYYIGKDGDYRLYSEQEFRTKFPRAFAYLHENQPGLRRRKQFKAWLGYSAPRNLELHDQAQIAIPLLANRGLFALIPDKNRGRLCPMASGGFTITIAKESYLKPEYVLGLLNSKLLFWRLGTLSNLFRGGWITCTKQYFGELPIHRIDFSVLAEKSRHDQIVHLVQQILALRQRRSAAKTPQEKTALDRQITAADTQIDRLVYDLYGLTEDEIKIVEGASL